MEFSRQEYWSALPCPPPGVLPDPGVEPVSVMSPELVGSECVRANSLQSFPTLCDPIGCSPPGSSVHGDSPGKNTGVRCYALLQEIFPTQGLKPHLLCLLH